MQILIVDDEEESLKSITRLVRSVRPEAEVHSFADPSEAMKAASGNRPDVAFLDIMMPGITGMELAAGLKEMYPDINIIFATSHSNYMGEAFKLHASGYLMKPLTFEMVERELSDLRHRIQESEKTVRIVTFGSFSVFVGDRPVEFKYSKSEEIFAILVDMRGKSVTTDRIKKLLWQYDASVKNHASYISILKKDMINTFSELGVKNIFRHDGGEIALIPEAVQCDYYDYMDNKPGAEPFKGRYMERYAWAEPTVARLSKL